MESTAFNDLEDVIEAEINYLFIYFNVIIFNKELIDVLTILIKMDLLSPSCGDYLFLNYFKSRYLDNGRSKNAIYCVSYTF
jgi:hypothetical protein